MKATPAKAGSPAKPAAKVAAKTAKVAPKAPPAKKAVAGKKSAVAKPAVKTASKLPAKTALKTPGKADPRKDSGKSSVATPPAKAAVATPTKKVAVAHIPPKAPLVSSSLSSPPTSKDVKDAPAAAPVAAPSASANPVQRPGRPSSRLAALTVPSMAQSVASTAAKASFSQLESAPLIVPPVHTAAKKDPKLANNWKTKTAEELSDAELLAMPDSEYMNEKQMAAFRSKLVQLKQGILNSAGETTEHLREDTVVVPDPADRATIEEEHALELRTRDRERKLLKKIEQSIGRIDSGDYGYCDETGEPIGVGRLLARPTATLSLEAQQRRELKQKMFGD